MSNSENRPVKTRTIAFISVVLTGLCYVACPFLEPGAKNGSDMSDAGSQIDAGSHQEPAYEGRSGGLLPLGYYELQCQWDACGGPKDDNVSPLTNPVR